jgi:hypothetical protein
MITLHLKAILDAIETFNERNAKVGEILALKKLYILTLEMTKEFNGFMRNSIQFFINNYVLWFLICIYRILRIKLGVSDDNEISEFSLKLLINFLIFFIKLDFLQNCAFIPPV